MKNGNPTSAKELAALLKLGEGKTLEFKRSTGELKEGLQTLCAFLNDAGGMLLFGVRPDGKAEGQDVTDRTLREIAQALDKFEPPVNLPVERLPVGGSKEVLILRVEDRRDSVPFTYDSRAYERVGSTTRKLPQEHYEKLLLERGHAKRRWENMPAEGLTLRDLARKEILRTRELAIQQNRISPDTGRNIGEILDRLGVRQDGVLLQAAQVLYGMEFINDYPQCLLKMGRFRGTEITGEIVDNRQERMNAFAMVREGLAFLERTMPLGARFPAGQVFREDRFPVPVEALREILLNAVMHRDYSYYPGYVAIVVFDDRIEIQSYGRLPSVVSLKQLSGAHLSELRNPLIAGAFHRTGAVECWGRGTNRVIAACERHGVPSPTFEERQGFVIVTFRAPITVSAREDSRVQSGVHSGVQSAPQSTDPAGTTSALSRHQVAVQLGTDTVPSLSQVCPKSVPSDEAARVLRAALSPTDLQTLMNEVGHTNRTRFRDAFMRPLIKAGLMELTVPDKPRSSKQRYRLTANGKAILEKP